MIIFGRQSYDVTTQLSWLSWQEHDCMRWVFNVAVLFVSLWSLGHVDGLQYVASLLGDIAANL